MNQKPEKIHFIIRYHEIEQQFSAEPQEAWLLLTKFFKEIVPSFEISQKLQLNIDLKQLAQDLAGIVAFSAECPNLLVPKTKLTDNEALMILLTAYHLGYRLGLVDRDSVSKETLQAKIGKNGKITSTRLGELSKNEWAIRDTNDEFKITTFGIVQTQKEVLPRIKTKIFS